jgi:ABC-type Zn uptake system ZnuABC Zn-binding protein ZnuA
MRRLNRPLTALGGVALAIFLVSCGGAGDLAPTEVGHAGDARSSLAPVDLAAGEKLQVVATTSIVHDVVANVGGELIDLSLLIPLGTDPHGFEPTPQDVTLLTTADVVMINGAGLETFMDRLIESTGATYRVVSVSEGIDLLPLEEHEEEDDHGDENDDHGHEEVDPHTWTDPNNVLIWVDTIEAALGALDPDRAETYGENAAAYRAELEELDRWIREQVASIPETKRQLVSDHDTFGYLARRYGLTQRGAIFPGGTTLAQPSARELAELTEAIRDLEVEAIFVGTTVSPDLARSIAEDTGIQVVTLYTGSLTRGDEADTYLDYMRANLSAIAGALR